MSKNIHEPIKCVILSLALWLNFPGSIIVMGLTIIVYNNLLYYISVNQLGIVRLVHNKTIIIHDY